jgi:hypothetical protein
VGAADELVEPDQRGRLVEDAHHDPLAVDPRHRYDAGVDRVAVDGQRDAAVLRDALLGDVEVGHDLHARDDARDHAPRDRRGLAQHAVHPEAHPHLAALGLEVDVRGELLDRLGDDRVDQLDHRRVVRGLADLGDVGDLRLALLDGLGHGFVEAAHAADQRGDVLARGHHWLHLVTGHQLEVVERDHVRRVRDRHAQATVRVEADRCGVQPPRRVRAHQVERGQVGLEDRQVDVAEPEALRDRARELVDGDLPRLQQNLLGRATVHPRVGKRLVHGLAAGEPERHEHLRNGACRAGHRRREASLDVGCGAVVCRRAPRYGAERRPASLLAHGASATACMRLFESW